MDDGAKTSARIRNGIRRSVPGASLGAVFGSVMQWRDGNSEAPLRLVRAIYREGRDARCPAAPRGTGDFPVPNARQKVEIERTVAIFAADHRVELLTWQVIDPPGYLRQGRQADGIYVEFRYRAHDDGPGLRPGREVTVFGEDGTVLDSQDFG
jgi:hypothetical protein